MIDYRHIGNGSVGPITKDLLRSYDDAVHGRGSHTVEWLDYVGNVEYG